MNFDSIVSKVTQESEKGKELTAQCWGGESPPFAEEFFNRERCGIPELRLNFSTKAETLRNLADKLTSATILPLYYFTVKEWNNNKNAILSNIKKCWPSNETFVIRSSAIGEDGLENSLAGKFASIVGVSEDSITHAIDQVIASFTNSNCHHQVLIQPYLSNVSMSGVAFGRDPNTDGAYIVINYDMSGSTTSITSGTANGHCYVSHRSKRPPNPTFAAIWDLVNELIVIFSTDYLDIEFAFDDSQNLYLFQVRPLIKQRDCSLVQIAHQAALERISHRVLLGMKPHPYLYGDRTVYGIMPDWNPAEIIGIRPKPLALSLYKELITDTVWAYQRDNYGYANLRSFPLLVDFEGLPYIDVRVSFNSFLPKDLPSELSGRLVNYYISRLIANPSLHDKVEFDIVFSNYVFNLQDRLNILDNYGFSVQDKRILKESLIGLTNRIVHNQEGFWKKDLNRINVLKTRQECLCNSNLDPIISMYWLVEDCKRYGTLPFAGLARAGFIAIQLLKSLCNIGILNENEYTNFLLSVDSISSNMKRDFNHLPREEFLKQYGHLRPGTYDILSPCYHEAPDLYFNWTKCNHDKMIEKASLFSLSISQFRQIQQQLKNDRLDIDVLNLLEFIKAAIEAREYSKFVFTRSVSMLLTQIANYASQFNVSREECAYINIKDVIALYSSSVDPKEILFKSIELGKTHYQRTSAIVLPPIICSPSDVWHFEIPTTLPNFITQKQVIAPVSFPDKHKMFLNNTIAFIPSADPGYDWIFAHDIAGLVTQYGGVNSHMAIRAGELGIPAVIGAGEIKYNEWSRAEKLHIDCLNQQVKFLCT